VLFDINRFFRPDMRHASAWLMAKECDAASSDNAPHEVDLPAVRVTFTGNSICKCQFECSMALVSMCGYPVRLCGSLRRKHNRVSWQSFFGYSKTYIRVFARMCYSLCAITANDCWL